MANLSNQMGASSVSKPPIELIHNGEYSNESINLDIDLTDCDELEITASTDINLANSVFIYFNNDTTTSNYTKRIIKNDVSVEGTGDPILLSNGNTRESTKMYVDKKAKTIYGRHNRKNTNGTCYLLLAFYVWTGGSDATSIKITSTGFTGILKIWKKY